MATRTIWQDLYGMELDLGQTAGSVGLAAHVAGSPSYGATDIGIQGEGVAAGKFSLPLTDHPNFKSPAASVDTEEARGLSVRHDLEFNVAASGDPIEFSAPMLGNAYNVAAMTKLLFQSGAEEDSPGNQTDMHRLTGSAYTDADVVNYGYFTRSMQPAGDSDGVDLIVKGGICSSLTLAGEQGGLLTVEPTIQAANWSQGNLTALTTTLASSFADITPLKYQDCTVGIEYSAGNWADIYTPNMSITVNTNPMFNFYNDDAAGSIHLGRMNIEGSMSFPWDPGDTNVEKNWVIDKFLGGEPFRVCWYWGQSGPAVAIEDDRSFDGDLIDRYKNDTTNTDPKNCVSVLVNAKCTDYEIAGDNELMIECSFQAVKDSTNEAIKIYSLYDDALYDLSA